MALVFILAHSIPASDPYYPAATSIYGVYTTLELAKAAAIRKLKSLNRLLPANGDWDLREGSSTHWLCDVDDDYDDDGDCLFIREVQLNGE